jgi:receptor expression-enhancing protein 5/6
VLFKDATKVPKEYLVSASAVCFFILLVIGIGVGSLTSMLGFGYPAVKSFQTIEAKNKGDNVQWLVYWVIFSFFAMAETFISYLLYWIPFYHAFKLAFLLWAMLPQTKGAKFLYETALKDFLKKNESKIDAALADAKKNAGAIASDVAKAGSEIDNSDSKKAT